MKKNEKRGSKCHICEKGFTKNHSKKNVDVNYSAIKAAMANVICKFLFLVQVSILSQQILSVYVYIVSKFFFNCCAFFFYLLFKWCTKTQCLHKINKYIFSIGYLI